MNHEAVAVGSLRGKGASGQEQEPPVKGQGQPREPHSLPASALCLCPLVDPQADLGVGMRLTPVSLWAQIGVERAGVDPEGQVETPEPTWSR